jgi:hypothetical protein
LVNQKNLSPVVSTEPAFVVPVVEGLHQKVLAAAKVEGAFDMADWHCGTSHCRAGHIVHAAGEAGYKLESITSTAFAAMQIAHASGLDITPPRFYESNDVAMADMERMAALEATTDSIDPAAVIAPLL